MHNDTIYNKLVEDETRDKILSGRLRREDCDHQKVFKFLHLLKQEPNHRSVGIDCMSIEDWTKEVKKAKKRSASSVQSK